MNQTNKIQGSQIMQTTQQIWINDHLLLINRLFVFMLFYIPNSENLENCCIATNFTQSKNTRQTSKINSQLKTYVDLLLIKYLLTLHIFKVLDKNNIKFAVFDQLQITVYLQKIQQTMYYLIQYGILIVICSYLVLTYASPSVSWHIKFWSILTWVLNFSLALLVPEDVYLTMLKPEPGTQQYQQQQIIAYEYLILYWSVYLLTWTIIPILQEWQNSGDLQSIDRLKRSFKVNGIFYLYMLIGGIIVVFLLVYFEVGGRMGLMTWLKCLATVWGIFLQMLMMGYAIVEIPRSLWLETNPEFNLQYSYMKIAQVEEQKNESVFQFKQIASFIIYIKDSNKFESFSESGKQKINLYCKQSSILFPTGLLEKIPSDPYQFLSRMNYFDSYPINNILKENPLSQKLAQNSGTDKNQHILLQHLVEHHRLLKRVLARNKRLTFTLDDLYRKAILCEDIINSSRSEKKQLESIVLDKSKRLNFIWNFQIKPILYKILACILSLLGIIILISETQIFLDGRQQSTTLLGWLIEIKNLEVLRVLVFIIIGFISYMVYYSLFSLKFSNIYGLYKHNSDGPSLMFATINFSRVAVAIVLNFFDMLKLKGIYTSVMGTVEMGLIGQWIIKGLPGVLWMIVLCHYLNLWGKLIRFLKLSSQLNFQSHEVPDGSSEDPSETIQKQEAKSWIKKEVFRYRYQLAKNKEFRIVSVSGL